MEGGARSLRRVLRLRLPRLTLTKRITITDRSAGLTTYA